jgi:glycosyltransferase involved in cell wall biosynthesis
MRIALLGTRGIPARYGGFETFAEELSYRLVERGHKVTVYCRQRHNEATYRGVRLRYLPTISHKYLETVAHTCLSTLDLMFRAHDVALYCNAANAVFTAFPRMVGVPVVLNVDGLERNRKKWNRLGKAWYQMGERLSTIFPSAVVSDARHIAEYYKTRYGLDTLFIPYGAETYRVTSTDVLQKLGLEPGKYFLYVSRMEPENNGLLVREAFEKVPTDMKLALIGDAPYARAYMDQVRATTDPRIVMPGAVYGQGYHELQSHCFAYIHATEVGGTHPALIEAMGRGALVLYLNTPENAEVAGAAAIPFEASDLKRSLFDVLRMTEQERQALSQRAVCRVREYYSWDAVVDGYEQLLTSLIQLPSPQKIASRKSEDSHS